MGLAPTAVARARFQGDALRPSLSPLDFSLSDLLQVLAFIAPDRLGGLEKGQGRLFYGRGMQLPDVRQRPTRTP
jgi:hypothetical protein